MNAVLGDPKFGYALVVILMGIITWMAREGYKRLRRVEEQFARREELEQLSKLHHQDMEKLRSDSERRHKQNSTLLGDIQDGVVRTHERIDDLFLKLLGNDK